MEDSLIIELYFNRNEKAVSETSAKYGSFLKKIAMNILSNIEDAKECENDTYLKAWDSIPPARPENFKAWLGRVARNIAINLWNKNHAQKRYSGLEAMFDELSECIPANETVEVAIEEKELSEIINSWLESLSKESRILFVRRYWHGDSVKALAAKLSEAPQKTAKRLYVLRQKLKAALEAEGISL